MKMNETVKKKNPKMLLILISVIIAAVIVIIILIKKNTGLSASSMRLLGYEGTIFLTDESGKETTPEEKQGLCLP